MESATANNVDLAIVLPKLWLMYEPLMLNMRKAHYNCWSRMLPRMIQYCAMTLTFIEWKRLGFSPPLIDQFVILADIGDLLLQSFQSNANETK